MQMDVNLRQLVQLGLGKLQLFFRHFRGTLKLLLLLNATAGRHRRRRLLYRRRCRRFQRLAVHQCGHGGGDVRHRSLSVYIARRRRQHRC